MASMKLNKTEDTAQQEQPTSYIKQNEEEGAGPKLFQNKKANKALIIAGVVMVVVIVGLVIFVNIPVG